MSEQVTSEQVEVSPEVQMLIERMKTNPEEFYDLEENWVTRGGEGMLRSRFRWSNVVQVFFSDGELADGIPKQDVEAFRAAYDAMRYDKFKQDIVKELVGGEYQQELKDRERQMELDLQAKRSGAYPYAPAATAIANKDYERELLRKLIEQEKETLTQEQRKNGLLGVPNW